MDRAESIRTLDVTLRRISKAGNSRRHHLEIEKRSGVPGSLSTIPVLSAIVRHGPMRLGAIADLTEMQQSRVSKDVRRLVESGYAVQSTDPSDRRATVVAATDAGTDAYRRFRNAADEELTERLESWSDRQIQTCVSNLERLAEALGAPLLDR